MEITLEAIKALADANLEYEADETPTKDESKEMKTLLSYPALQFAIVRNWYSLYDAIGQVPFVTALKILLQYEPQAALAALEYEIKTDSLPACLEENLIEYKKEGLDSDHLLGITLTALFSVEVSVTDEQFLPEESCKCYVCCLAALEYNVGDLTCLNKNKPCDCRVCKLVNADYPVGNLVCEKYKDDSMNFTGDYYGTFTS